MGEHPLLFWLSLVPFVTGWMGENHFDSIPTAAYAVVMLLAGGAYLILQKAIVAHQSPDSKLRAALSKDRKGPLSALFYALAIPLAFVNQWISDAIFVLVAAMWFVPDKRIEAVLNR